MHVALGQKVNVKAHVSASSLSSTRNSTSFSNPYRAFVRLLRAQLGQSFEMYMQTKRVHIHRIVGV
jgi:hypothetical protein